MPQKPSDPRPFRPRAVLLVEANVHHAFLLEEKFREAFPDVKMMKAASVTEASLLLASRNWDLVILDTHLPDGNGNDLIGCLSTHPTTAVAVLTDSSQEDIHLDLDYDGPIQYLMKDRQTLESVPRWVEKLVHSGKKIERLIQQGPARQVHPGLHDPLTQTYSREYFEDYLGREVSRANRYLHEFGVMIVDVDRPEEGCLPKLAAVLRQVVRGGDLVARYDGDQFVVLLNQCLEGDAVRCAQRVRRQLTQEQSRFTVSIGLVHYRGARKVVRMQAILSEAEQALAEAKRQGGDRHILAS